MNLKNAYERLFEPMAIGGKLTLRNRLVMAPMTTVSGEADGSFSEGEIAYLARRAEAGIGLIMTPACYCHKSGHAFDHQVGCHTDSLLPGLSRCAAAINSAGAASFLQIHHGGNAVKAKFSGEPPWAPSALLNRRGTSELPMAMSEEQIQTIVDAFGSAAGRAREAGFTGIEIHGANTYLFQQFFSPFTNRREDHYGCQSMENRSRFAREVVSAVRQAVGSDYPIAYRISPEEPEPQGYSTVEAIELLEQIVPLGIDIVHVSSWQYATGVRDDYPPNSHPTKMIRDALPDTVPVVGVGGVFHPDDALRILDDGVDLVAMGRQLLLEPDWVQKVQAGRLGEIRMVLRSELERQALEIPEPMKQYIATMVPVTPPD